MANNFKTNEIEKAFFHDGYQLGIKSNTPEFKQTHLFNSLKEMYKNIDELTKSLYLFAKQQDYSISCKKGCEWCCHQPVFALDYELEYLNFWISANFNKKEITETQIKAKEKLNKLSNLKGNDLLNSKYPCPLLQNKCCSAYDARPMACRIYISTDVKSCEYFYRKPDDKNHFPTLLELPMQLGRIMNEGFKAALKTTGIIAKEYRIEEKLIQL